MKVVLLSSFYPRKVREYYLNNSKSGLSAAADAHQYAIALGLRYACDDFEIVNLPAIDAFPFHYKKCSVPSEVIEENGLTINNVGSSTIFEIQFYSKYHNAYKQLSKIIKRTDGLIYIVVYEVNLPLMKAALKIKERYNNVKLNLIVPDLPEDLKCHEGFARKLLWKFRGVFFKEPLYYYRRFDTFILLTEFMKERIGCKEDQYIVSEGVYEEKTLVRDPNIIANENFVVFYSGKLHQKFGVKNLLDAFSLIKDDNIHLVICGTGDCENYIRKLSEKDRRIHFLGFVSREIALREQTKASLLINPRVPDDNPYTKYSFPSKTMEYFASSKPTLLYKLDGIPSEYYNYCYTLDKDQIDPLSLANKIIEIYHEDETSRLELATKAREFVLERKNYKVVGRQIVKFLDKTK